jgi:hypothetical protein
LHPHCSLGLTAGATLLVSQVSGLFCWSRPHCLQLHPPTALILPCYPHNILFHPGSTSHFFRSLFPVVRVHAHVCTRVFVYVCVCVCVCVCWDSEISQKHQNIRVCSCHRQKFTADWGWLGVLGSRRAWVPRGSLRTWPDGLGGSREPLGREPLCGTQCQHRSLLGSRGA